MGSIEMRAAGETVAIKGTNMCSRDIYLAVRAAAKKMRIKMKDIDDGYVAGCLSAEPNTGLSALYGTAERSRGVFIKVYSIPESPLFDMKITTDERALMVDFIAAYLLAVCGRDIVTEPGNISSLQWEKRNREKTAVGDPFYLMED